MKSRRNSEKSICTNTFVKNSVVAEVEPAAKRIRDSNNDSTITPIVDGSFRYRMLMNASIAERETTIEKKCRASISCLLVQAGAFFCR